MGFIGSPARDTHGAEAVPLGQSRVPHLPLV